MLLTTLFVSDKSNVRMKSNLPPEHKRMHKFTEVASGEREKEISCHHTFCHNDKSYEVMKSNLHAEHKRMHKFTKVASGEREEQISCHSPHFFVRVIKVMYE